ncbi:MAG: threonine synthase [Gemmataceae bacterium]|nr:threonine synthase [Gemmataceae bacterium]MBX9626718.1 threonine synthase [Gemmataceae bacterium]
MHVSHLEAAIDGTVIPFGGLVNTHNGRPVLVRYDLERVRAAVSPDAIARRPPTLWRYRELLPLPPDVEPVSLGEGMTPLLECPRLGEQLGLNRLFVKDESQLPTGSFKSRGMAVAVSMAKWLGVNRVALPTAGNAGGAAAAYAARAGMECFVFMPADTPAVNQFEPHLYGAKAFRVNGLITDCGKIVRDGADRMGWFDLSTLKEPYRLEGKKTMGLELAEQLGWTLPDVILYPTGGGTGLIGMWKAFAELASLGWLKSGPHPLSPSPAGGGGTREDDGLRASNPSRPGGGGRGEGSVSMPRLISCQAEGCAPIVTAWGKGGRFADPFPNARTVASGLRVPAAVGDFLMLDAIRGSGGKAVAGSEAAIGPWMRRASSAEGIAVCPESAVCFDVLEKLVAAGEVKPDETVVVFNTGAAPKYLEALPAELPAIDKDAVDWGVIGG